MSDKAKNGSDSGHTRQTDTETKSLDVKDLPSFSPTGHYLDQVESHERTAIGQAPEDSIQDRVARVEKEIKESEEKLNG
ncbi:hypothetical protein DL98DRAFT_588490 [Cadophora sp. DSE1049]|nr:hypothetical protein DL98DRAFT_588490 [Cadophora sp. DSE1049]